MNFKPLLDIDRDRRRASLVIVLLVAAALLPASASAARAGCPGCDTAQASRPIVASAAPVPRPAPAMITVPPAPAAQDVSPAAPVLVRASAGTLTDVQMVNEDGKAIAGIMTPDRVAWKPAVALGYGRTYTLTVRSRGAGGMAAAQTSTFSTLTPSDQTSVELTTTSA